MTQFDKTISYFFYILNNVKLYHWKTTSYARHKATDAFVSELGALVDQFVESYSGKYERPGFEQSMTIKLRYLSDDNIENELIDFRRILNEMDRMDMLSDKDTDLLNIRDEMMALVNKTLYLFSLN